MEEDLDAAWDELAEGGDLMLEQLEGVVLAVRDAEAAVKTYERIFDAKFLGSNESEIWKARIAEIGVGTDIVRLAEPSGPGAVQEHLERVGEGLFAAVFSSKERQAVADRLTTKKVSNVEENGLVFVDPSRTFGLRTLVSKHSDRQPVGIMSFLYEVTHLVHDWKAASEFWTDAFGLEGMKFSPIRSEHYGYDGVLTLFDPPRLLDRIEVVTPYDTDKAMGKFFVKRGEGPYMFYTECSDTNALAERLDAAGARYAGDPKKNASTSLFIHPTATHGVLIGVSPTNQAWVWSGRPELAEQKT
jgi:catechol 2,3-dioxygenase-like lactoylglutathione lyase family enzyme